MTGLRTIAPLALVHIVFFLVLIPSAVLRRARSAPAARARDRHRLAPARDGSPRGVRLPRGLVVRTAGREAETKAA
jgi:hypothetical protein